MFSFLIHRLLAYPTANQAASGVPPRQGAPQMYPQLHGNTSQAPYRPAYGGNYSGATHHPSHHTTVVVQPSPSYGGGGYGGYNHGSSGNTLAGVGLGLAGGALLGGKLNIDVKLSKVYI